MTYCHHAITLNGRRHYDLESSFDNSRDFMARLMSRLDGEERYSLVLGALPPDQGLAEIDTKTWPPEYLQCAGSSKAMTIEIRTGVGDGAKQYIVGRSATHSGEPSTDIPWNGYISTVYPDEVFSAEEATELFAYYLVHNTVPAELSLRWLDLNAGPTTRPR